VKALVPENGLLEKLESVIKHHRTPRAKIGVWIKAMAFYDIK
jgi:hypothetical protein